MSKIIFLDIDGVLNSETDFTDASRKYDPIHSKLQKGERWKIISAGKLALLNDVVTQTGASIVLSSTWRHQLDYAKLTKVFQRYGDIWEHDANVFVGKTKNMGRGINSNHNYYRQMEIEQYIEEHDVREYIIIDDCNDIQLPDDRFIKTDEYAGMTVIDANRAKMVLGRTEKYQKKFDKEMQILRAFF